MAKKDFHNTGENIDREKKNTDTAAKEQAESKGSHTENQLTEVKNASASGLGTIGRNDQEQTDTASNY